MDFILLPDLRGEVRAEQAAYRQHSAAVMTQEGINTKRNLYGDQWHKPLPASEPCAITPDLTACMLLEAVCKTLKQGRQMERKRQQFMK